MERSYCLPLQFVHSHPITFTSSGHQAVRGLKTFVYLHRTVHPIRNNKFETKKLPFKVMKKSQFRKKIYTNVDLLPFYSLDYFQTIGPIYNLNIENEECDCK